MLLVHILACFLFLPFFVHGAVEERDYGYESRLHRDLFGNQTSIGKTTRPSIHSNQTTHLSFGISLIHVVGLDPETHSLHANVWCRSVWYDYNVQWNAEDYGGINVLRIPPSYVWKPDVILLNALESMESEMSHLRSNILVYPEGQVLWVPSATYKTICAVDLYKFPFDSHTCFWIFRSWSNEGKDLRMDFYSDKKYVDLSDFWENAEWSVEDIDFADDLVSGKFDGRSIGLAIRFHRRSYFYVLTLIIPILLSWLITMVLFFIPVSSNQRVFLTSLNVFYLQLLTIAIQWILPNNGIRSPRIVTFCGQSVIFAALSLLFSIVLVAMSKSLSPRRLPSDLKNALVGWMGRSLFLGRHHIRGVSLGARLLTSSNVELNVNSHDKGDYDETHEDWTLLAVALNRLVFIIYSISFVAIIIATWLSF